MFFFHGPFDIVLLAVAIAIVIKPITRAAGEFARARALDRSQDRAAPRAMDDESRERIEALEERLRLVEERQDFTEKLVSGRRDEPALPPSGAPETSGSLEAPVAGPSDASSDGARAPATPDVFPDALEKPTSDAAGA